MKFRMVSLGCPKNLVDSEYLARRMTEAGHELAEEADLVIVNTCAFIAEAAKESIDTIIQEGKGIEGRGGKLVVAGCLVERYGESLPGLLPEVDLYVGRGRYHELEKLIGDRGLFAGPKGFKETFPRQVLTQPPSAYLKIQEGCDNRCSYCTIPLIRGPLSSRGIEDVREEFVWLLGQGFKEFNIIGQDITAYGTESGRTLRELLASLLDVKGDFFLRLLYMHPRGVTNALIDLIAAEERVIPYFDLPIQHSEDRILKLMGRGYTRTDLEGLVARIRTRVPDAVLRSTVIVGFPGETEEEFARLCDFLSDVRFDNLGAFMYSKEEGTAAARLRGHLRKGIKKARFQRVMEIQKEISRNNMLRLVGRPTKVIVESEEGGRTVGRMLSQAPDVDGLAFIQGECKVGEVREGIVKETLDYDVVVRVGGADGANT